MQKHGSLALLFLLLLASACTRAPYQVTRTLADKPVKGVYVSPYAYEHYIRGEIAMEEKDYVAAERGFALARTGPEDDPFVISRQALAIAHQKRFEEAFAVLAEAKQLDAEHESVFLTRGDILVLQERYDDALVEYVRAHRSAPDSSKPPSRIVMLLSHTKQGRAELLLLSKPSAALVVALAEVDCNRDNGALSRARDAVLRLKGTDKKSLRKVAKQALSCGRPWLAATLLESDSPSILRAEARALSFELSAAQADLTVSNPKGYEKTLWRLWLLLGDVTRARLSVDDGDIADAESLRLAELSDDPNALPAVAEKMRVLVNGQTNKKIMAAHGETAGAEELAAELLSFPTPRSPQSVVRNSQTKSE